jgi:hypothetical protein
LREAREQWNSFPRWARALYGLTCLLAVLVPAVLLFASRHDRGRMDGDALQATAAAASQLAAGEDAAAAHQAADAHSPPHGQSGSGRGVGKKARGIDTHVEAGEAPPESDIQAEIAPKEVRKPDRPAGREDAGGQPAAAGQSAGEAKVEGEKPGVPADEVPEAAETPATSAAAESEAPAASANPNHSIVDPAVKALLAAAKSGDNPYHYIFPPVVERKLSYQEVPQRYSVRMIMAPVFQSEAVTVTQPVTQGTQTLMTTRQQPVAGRPLGMRPVKMLVPDPSGPIVRIVKQPVWGPGGPDRESIGWLGNNAMALVALLRSGVDPEREPVLKTLADRLSQHLQAFDSPDATWDVAWTMIALAEYPGGRYHDRLERLLGRLISGQIAEGPGKGLWGPVCVNPVLLRQAVEVVFKNLAALPQGAGGAARGPARPPVRPGMNPAVAALQTQIAAAQERAFIEMNAVSALGPSFAQATFGVTLKDARNQYGNDIDVPGWPVNVYRELTSDLESTALAAYALRIATTRAKLPAPVEYPHGISFCRSFSVRNAVAAAIHAVAAAQRIDGSWDEMTVWQTVDEFRNGGAAQFGPPVAAPEALPAGRPPIATAQACNALEDLLLVLGRLEEPKKAARPARSKGRLPEVVKLAAPAQYRQQIARGRQRLLEMIGEVSKAHADHEALAEDRPARPGKRPAGRPQPPGFEPLNPVWGGVLEPYALLGQLRLEAETDAAPDDAAAGRIALSGLMTSAAASQEASGLWPAPANFLPCTPSVRQRALYLVAPPASSPKKAPSHPGAKKTPPISQPARTMQELLAVRERVCRDPRFWGADPEEAQRLATAYMLCYLAGTVHVAPSDSPSAHAEAGHPPPAASDTAP